MIKDSKQHLKDANETYSEHFNAAIKIGFTMIYGGLQAIIHAIIPGILRKAASDKIKRLYDYVVNRVV